MANAPKVVRIRISNGIVIQDCDVYIGREVKKGGWNLEESEWHNPFVVNATNAKRAVSRFEEYLIETRQDLIERIKGDELTGKTLGCWCSPGPCHGDVIRRLYIEYHS